MFGVSCESPACGGPRGKRPPDESNAEAAWHKLVVHQCFLKQASHMVVVLARSPRSGASLPADVFQARKPPVTKARRGPEYGTDV